MGFLPKKDQFKRWSLPSKYSFYGFVLTILGIILAIFFYIFDLPKVSDASDDNQFKIAIDSLKISEDSTGIDSINFILDSQIDINRKASIKSKPKIRLDYSGASGDGDPLEPSDFYDYKIIDLHVNSPRANSGSRSWGIYSNQLDSIAKLVSKGGVLPPDIELSNMLPAYMVFYLQNLSGSESPSLTIRELCFNYDIEYKNRRTDSIYEIHLSAPFAEGYMIDELQGSLTLKLATNYQYLRLRNSKRPGGIDDQRFRFKLDPGAEVYYAIELDSEHYGQYLINLDMSIIAQYTNEIKTVVDTIFIQDFARFNVIKTDEPLDIIDAWDLFKY